MHKLGQKSRKRNIQAFLLSNSSSLAVLSQKTVTSYTSILDYVKSLLHETPELCKHFKLCDAELQI